MRSFRSAQLIDAREGYHLWSDSHDRELEDVFAIQDDIARPIVDALKVGLISEEESDSLVHQTTSRLEAYQLYLKGRFVYNKFTEQDLIRLSELIVKGLRRAPTSQNGRSHMNTRLLAVGCAVLWALLLRPPAVAAQQVTVSFYNPGYAAQLIYRYDPSTNQEVYFGGVAGGVTTNPIPSRPNEIWRFRLASNRRHVEDYVVTSQPQQFHEVQGFLTNAREPDQSFIQRAVGDLARAIEIAWDEMEDAAVYTAEGTILAIGQTGNLQARVNRELQQHRREILGLLRWYREVGRALHAPSVRHLVETRNYQGLATLIRLHELRAIQGARGPARGGPILAASRPDPQATPGSGLVSVGFTVDGSFLAGGSAEAGVVWEAGIGNPLPVGFYTSTAHGFGASIGVDVSFSIGFWEVGLDQFLGKSVGVGMALDPGAGLGVALWFSCGRSPQGPVLIASSLVPGLQQADCPLSEDSRFLGATIQPGVGVSAEFYEVNVGLTEARH